MRPPFGGRVTLATGLLRMPAPLGGAALGSLWAMLLMMPAGVPLMRLIVSSPSRGCRASRRCVPNDTRSGEQKQRKTAYQRVPFLRGSVRPGQIQSCLSTPPDALEGIDVYAPFRSWRGSLFAGLGEPLAFGPPVSPAVERQFVGHTSLATGIGNRHPLPIQIDKHNGAFSRARKLGLLPFAGLCDAAH